MKKTVVRVVALDMLFLLLLTVAGAFSGVPSEIIYIAAYLLPLALFPLFAKGERRERIKLLPSGSDALLCLPLIAPTITLTIGLSALTSYLMSLGGMGGAESLDGSLFELLILHALLPAVLEEALYRYVPLTLIAPYSKRSALIISALLFAVAHCNIAQMPYAFVAGIIFAALDLFTGSILPSVALHLLNNLASVFWMWDVSAPTFRAPFIALMLALTAVSVALVAIFHRRYLKKVSFLVDTGDKIRIACEVWLFCAVCLALAVGSFL